MSETVIEQNFLIFTNFTLKNVAQQQLIATYVPKLAPDSRREYFLHTLIHQPPSNPVCTGKAGPADRVTEHNVRSEYKRKYILTVVKKEGNTVY